MRHALTILVAACLTVIAAAAQRPRLPQPDDTDGWTSTFAVEPGELAAAGRNPYFILEPGYQLILEGGSVRLTVRVLDATRTVAGVETRVVEERETDKGNPIEVSLSYFAISTRTPRNRRDHAARTRHERSEVLRPRHRIGTGRFPEARSSRSSEVSG